MALPIMLILSPRSSQNSFTVREETCLLLKLFFPSLSDQKGARVQQAEPVTGSSGIPSLGAKYLDTKSTSVPSAVAIMPDQLPFVNKEKSGSRFQRSPANRTQPRNPG